MYENIYTYNETIKGKSTWIIFKPNFREAITLFNGKSKLSSDGEIRMEGELKLDGARSEYPDVYVSEDAQWLLTDEGDCFFLFVTERTNEIQTELGKEWNNQFNWLLKKAKNDYFHRKKEEVRLYFYDSDKEKLRLCYEDGDCFNENYKYSLSRYFPATVYCAIDKRYAKPEKSCFILGRVRKTIGLKNSKLLDFIEPVHKVELDFEKEDWDWDFGEYKENKAVLEKNLLKLLRFCISKRNSQIEVRRIRAYLKNYEGSEKEVVLKFRNEIWTAFKTGNAEELRKLVRVLVQMQDCTNVKFYLWLKSEIECDPDKKFDVYFENGEVNYLPAKWIYANIHNCVDTSGVYVGEVRDRYNFY